MTGIYKITNKINGHCYIGQSLNIKKRWEAHKIAFTNINDQGYNYPLYRAFRKYGIDNFTWEILEEVKPDLLDEKEIYYIQLFNSFQVGYNQTPGGNQGGGRILTPQKVTEIQTKLLTQNYTLQQLSIEYGVHKDTIRDINNGTTWSTLNPNLKYPLYISHKNSQYQNKKSYCKKCGIEISYGSQLCIKCYKEDKQKFHTYPDIDQLIEDIKTLGFCGAGRKYGVSDNAVRKHCKKLGLSTYKKDYK